MTPDRLHKQKVREIPEQHRLILYDIIPYAERGGVEEKSGQDRSGSVITQVLATVTRDHFGTE